MASLTPKTAFGKTIRVDQQDYTFVSHKTAVPMAYAQAGGKGTVYQLKGSDGQHWALKVFHPQYRHPRITTINGALKENYESIPSITIWKRLTIRRPRHSILLEEYPDLEYAVLMPWVEGDNWENYWGDDELTQFLNAKTSLHLATELGKTLSQMELSAIAHCDLAGSNIMVDSSQARVELIDIEDSFIHGIEPPSAGSIPLGTSGYQHTASRGLNYGLWCAEGDRFAGAVLLAELLTWHVPEIRAASDGAKHYFQDSDLKEPKPANDRFKLMVDVLKTGSIEVADLFARAWGAPTLVECPRLTDWHEALKKANPTDASIFNILEAPMLNVAEYASESEKDGPLFSWNEIKGAKDYVLEFSLDSNFPNNSKKTRQRECLDCRYTSKDNQAGTFYARVKARSGKRESAWSKPIVFGRLPASTLNKNGVANEIRLSWTPVAKASYYDISIIGSATPQEDREYQSTECKVDFTAYAPGVYTVFVRAFGTIAGFQGRLVGYVSNSINISVPARKPDGLAVSKTGFAAKVSWQPVEYAAYYRVICQPLGKSGFDTLTQEARSLSADFQLPPGAYEFQVIAFTEDSIPSTASIRRETVGGLKTPRVTVSEQGKKHLLQWEPIDFADKYMLDFTRNGSEREPVETSHLNYAINSDWEPGTYQVSVRAIAKLDGFPEVISSEPSNPVVLTIRPSRPTWERSKVRVDDNIVTLAWNKLLRVTHYRVYYRNTSSNQSEWTETNDTKIRLTLTPATYDFWIVAHYGEITSEKSATQTLVLEKPVPIPAWVRASSEEDIIQLEWTPIEGATRYKIEIQGAIPTTVVDWDDTYLELCNPPGAYRIRLAACIDELQSQWSEETIVETTLATPKILGPNQIEPGEDFTIEWSKVQFATSYKIYDYGYISPQNEKILDKPRNKWGSPTTSRTLMRQHRSGQMAFRVVAFRQNESGEEYTSESELHIVAVGTSVPPLTIETPEYGTVGADVELRWQFHTNALQYELEWDYDESFSNPTLLRCETANVAIRFTHIGVVFVRVRPIQDNSSGLWSKTAQIVIQPERLKAFTARISGHGSYVQWDAVPNADLYRIEWSVEQSFISHDSRTAETQDTFTIIPSSGLYARVKALNTSRNVNWEWSDTFALPPYDNSRIHVTFDAHEYQYSLGEPVIINWRLTDETSEIHHPRFDLQIADNEDFVNPASHEVLGFSTTLSLNEVNRYFARVRFLRDTYACAWSSISHICVQPVEIKAVESQSTTTVEASAPVAKPRLGGFLKNLLNRPKELQRPLLKVTTSAELIVLHWSAVSSASHYEIQVTLPNSKTQSKKRPAADGTEMRIPKAKLAQGVYSCHIIAIDLNANLKSEPSNVVIFQAK